MKNIVWLASYPKSGNTWLRIFLANYLKNDLKPVSLKEMEKPLLPNNLEDFEDQIGLDPQELAPEEIDLYRPDLYRSYSEEAGAGGTVYIKTHEAFVFNAHDQPVYPEEISKGVVYLIRNPLDISVSYHNHLGFDLKRCVTALLSEDVALGGVRGMPVRQRLKSWTGHLKSWQQQRLIPVHIVRYEDMVKDPAAAFGSIVRFLGLEDDEERLKRALGNSDFRLLQQMEQKDGFKELTHAFFWKGKIGNYRDHLSEEQIGRIVEYHFDTLKEFGYIDGAGELTV